MGSATILLSIVAVVVMLSYTEAGNCPQPSSMYGCKPKCKQNFDCKNEKICCRNSCIAKSCTDPASYGGISTNSGGTGVYCDNAKCNSYEVCKQDPATKRMKCCRA